MTREPHDTQAHAYRIHTHTHQVRVGRRSRGAQTTTKTSEVSRLGPGSLGWQIGVREGLEKPRWLSTHVVTVVLVTALKFFFVAISTSLENMK